MRFWMERAITDLQLLEQRRIEIKGLDVQIRRLDADAICLPGLNYGNVAVQDNNSKQNRWLSTFMETKQELEKKQKLLQALVEHTELALNSLPDREQVVLSEMYTKRLYRGDAVRQLEEQLHIGRSEVYRIRERALRRFASYMGYRVLLQ